MTASGVPNLLSVDDIGSDVCLAYQTGTAACLKGTSAVHALSR